MSLGSFSFNTKDICYRIAFHADYDSLGEVMFDAVRNGESQYSEEQREVWVPYPRTGADWAKRLDSQFVIAAFHNSESVGFMSLAERGYIDFAYIRPNFRGRGIFRRLYEKIDAESRRQQLNRLWVHVSLNAKVAFESLGFSVVTRETVEISGIELHRFEMEKSVVG